MVLLVVGQFAAARAAAAFEQTIETAASHVVKLAREGHAVGFATDGLLVGGRPGVVPVSRSSSQISIILEALARVTMTPGRRLLDILSGAYPLPWGVSCLLFSYGPGEAIQQIEAAMKHRNVPMVCFHKEPPDP